MESSHVLDRTDVILIRNQMKPHYMKPVDHVPKHIRRPISSLKCEEKRLRKQLINITKHIDLFKILLGSDILTVLAEFLDIADLQIQIAETSAYLVCLNEQLHEFMIKQNLPRSLQLCMTYSCNPHMNSNGHIILHQNCCITVQKCPDCNVRLDVGTHTPICVFLPRCTECNIRLDIGHHELNCTFTQMCPDCGCNLDSGCHKFDCNFLPRCTICHMKMNEGQHVYTSFCQSVQNVIFN
jgi:hypothetical protein